MVRSLERMVSPLLCLTRFCTAIADIAHRSCENVLSYAVMLANASIQDTTKLPDLARQPLPPDSELGTLRRGPLDSRFRGNDEESSPWIGTTSGSSSPSRALDNSSRARAGCISIMRPRAGA